MRPFVSNERPLPNSTGAPSKPLIHFDISDLEDGLDPATVSVRVNSQMAFQAGSGFLFPFQGAGSDAYATVVDGHDGYHVAIDPTDDLSGVVLVSVLGDDAYGTGGGSWTFTVAGAALNFLYYSDGYGVRRIGMPALAGESQDVAVLLLSETTVPALPTNDVSTLFGNKIGDNMFLLTSMDGYPDAVGVLITTNEVNDPRPYLDGYDAYAAQMTDDGTMYVLNRTLNRVETYYGANFRPGNREPDFYYDAYSTPPLIEGELLDLHVASGHSVVHAGSTRFYVGSTEGMVRVDTYDEESPDGYSADMDGYGLSWTYGVAGSGMDYEVLGSPTDPNTAKEVVAVHSDDVGGLILVVTNDGLGNGGLTQINLNVNRRILFMNQEGGFLPTNYARDVFKKSS